VKVEHRRITSDEFALWEHHQELKHEFVDGHVVRHWREDPDDKPCGDCLRLIEWMDLESSKRRVMDYIKAHPEEWDDEPSEWFKG
jgi:hypothetical protein